MSKPKICLNMIVKNESHIIKETLECVSKYIDYYVINDTGSTDDTINVIKTFFDSKGIKGEIVSHEFRTCKCHMGIYKNYSFFHFGWNRTYALQQCVGKSEYIWVIDADDLIIGEMDTSDMKLDSYLVTIGSGFTYKRAQFFKNDKSYNWRYIGPLHEYPTCDKKNYSSETLKGQFYVDSRRMGDRSKVTDKYARDARVFEEVLVDESRNERYMFYCAQSYFDDKDFTNSLRWYKKRVEVGGWWEETYFAMVRIGECLEKLKEPWPLVEKAYLDAYALCNIRSESLYYIAKHYRVCGDYVNGYKYAKMAARIEFPEKCMLFVFRDVYDYQALYETAICAHGLGKFSEAYMILKKLLEQGKVKGGDCEMVRCALEVSERKMSCKNKKTCCFYFGDISYGAVEGVGKVIDVFKGCYSIMVMGSNLVGLKCEGVIVCSKIDDVKFDYLVLIDHLNYFWDSNICQSAKAGVKSDHVVLLQFDELLKIHLYNGIFVSLHGGEYLVKCLKGIHKIVCVNDKVMKGFCNNYEFDGVDNLDVNHVFGVDKCKYVFKGHIDNNFNGLVYWEPKWMKHMVDNVKMFPYMKGLIYGLYDEIMKKWPMMNEHLMKLFDMKWIIEDYIGAECVIDKLLNVKGLSGQFKDVVLMNRAKVLSKKGKYDESYVLCCDVLERGLVPEEMRGEYENIRDSNIEYIKNKYLMYPSGKIKGLKVGNGEIMFSITTCKRFDLFEKTMNSFLNCCMDYGLISLWLCVDDNSDIEDVKKMKKLYPFFKFICKNEKEKGHWISMNMIREYAISKGAKYLLHIEDDWHFIQKRNYIGDGLKLLDEDKMYGQVLFNRNYAEAEFVERKIGGGVKRVSSGGMRYVVHEHYDVGSKEYDEFIARHKGIGTCGYWEGFSFRPSVLKVDVLKDVGSYYNTGHFERAYAIEYKLKGYKSIFFDTYTSLHIGKKTWESSANSYALNNMKQFSLGDVGLNVNVLTSDVEKWGMFKENVKEIIGQYTRCEVKKIVKLGDSEKKLFCGNDFGYDRVMISSIMTHLNLMRDNKCEWMIFLRDDVIFKDKFKVMWNDLVNVLKGECDLVLLDGKVDVCFEIMGGYAISRDGCKKVLEYVNKNGVRSVNYGKGLELVIKVHDGMYDYNYVSEKRGNWKEFDGYKFYCLMDSFGNDVGYWEGKSVDDLKIECDKMGAKGFNTLGWVKDGIVSEHEFINLPGTDKLCDGLYVKM